MSHVYLVVHKISGEGDTILGVFTDSIKARRFDLDYLARTCLFDTEWTEIRRVEIDSPCYLGELV